MKVPFRNTFDNAKKYNRYADNVLISSTILLIVAFILPLINKSLESVSCLIKTLNCILILFYAGLDFMSNYTFFEASKHKRADFIDNSFGTSFSEDNSTEYFSNENIQNGYYKMAVNGFENSLFSYNISKLMLPNLWIKNAIIAILFIFIAIAGYNNAIILFLQLFLPVYLLSKAIKHTLFVNRVGKVFEDYRRLFQDLKDKPNKDFKTPEIIINVLEYETVYSWGCILLDSNIYNLKNDELSRKWEKIKSRYKI